MCKDLTDTESNGNRRKVVDMSEGPRKVGQSIKVY